MHNILCLKNRSILVVLSQVLVVEYLIVRFLLVPDLQLDVIVYNIFPYTCDLLLNQLVLLFFVGDCNS